ncbi:MAG: alpha-ketoacid dehydrogenase subunit beta [Actinobacteria bacterium]|nr:alpha-ketoacid dehydrogenase subunit beta [Actinomycetota bacterium]
MIEQRKKLTIVEALRAALRDEMRSDESVYVIGEDVRIGGSFGITIGLFAEFGERRVLDTPISESGYIGLSIGSSMFGLRPVADFQFSDFVMCSMDQIINQAAKLRYMSGGQVKLPMVVRFPGGNNGRGAQHAQSLESYFAHTPGLIVIAVSTPKDGYGLLRAAIRDDNPVMFFEHKLLYGSKGLSLTDGGEPDRDFIYEGDEVILPIGKADVKLEGKHLSLVATHLMLYRSLEAANELASDGIYVEVIDPRTLAPYDHKTIVNSVNKTGKLLVVEEENPICSWGASLIADMVELTGSRIKAKRISSPNSPVPYAKELIDNYVPSKDRIKNTILDMLERGY